MKEWICRELSTSTGDNENGVLMIETELIRCKDCKFWVKGKTTLNCPNPYICDFHSFMHGFERSVLPEDYCSFAERRTE